MHRRAEYGVAAHWKYKDDAKSAPTAQGERAAAARWCGCASCVDWQRETEDPSEFLDSLRFEMNVGEVYVFTPKGEVVSLPAGSTPVDFAYAVHTEVGHHTIGGRVNGRLVPLESTLENGDVVEVLTSKADGAGPSRDWLQFVKSAAGAQQDPAVVLQGAPRGGHRARQGGHRQGDAPAEAPAAAADVGREPHRASRASCATATSTACTRRWERATSPRATS